MDCRVKPANDRWSFPAHVLFQKCRRALPGDLGCVGVVAAALVAMKSVAGALVDIDLAVGTFLLDDFHVGHRDALIGLAEMHLHRAFRLLIGERNDAAAVIGYGRAQTQKPRGREKRVRASKAPRRN